MEIKGEKNYCIDGKEIISVKMYSNLNKIWNSFQKNYYQVLVEIHHFYFSNNFLNKLCNFTINLFVVDFDRFK